MSYNGSSYRIPCDRGGLNASQNEELIRPEFMVPGTKNLNLGNGGREKRGGSTKIFTTAITGNPTITGIYDYMKPQSSAYVVMTTSDGKILRNSTTELKSGLSTNRYSSFTTFDENLIICNGADIPQTWDASDPTTSDIGNDSIDVPDVPDVVLKDIVPPTDSLTIEKALGGGNLTTGTYKYVVTYTTAAGETTQGVTTSGEVLSYESPKHFVLRNIQIGLDEATTGRKIYRTIVNGSDYYLVTTIADNSTTMFVDNVADVSLGVPVNTVNDAAAGVLNNGVYKYKVTYTNNFGETEGSDEDIITISDKTVTGQTYLTGISCGGVGITSRKIYRTVADGSAYLLLDTISDNITVDYTDNKTDASLGAAIPTSSTALALPSDWSGGNYPTQCIAHGRGNSSRVWFFGCPATPYTIYASPNGDSETLDDENITTILMDTGEAYGILGGVVLDDKLVCFGKRKSFILDDADANPNNWGYNEAPWKGGVASFRLIVETPNDILCMTDDGEIYSIKAAQKFGDYGHASVTRSSYIHTWIKENVRLGYINHFHGIYDPVLRVAKFFVVRNGQTECDTVLTYFIDRGDSEGWMIHDNLDYASGCNAASSTLVRVGAGEYQIYTGDYSGFMWRNEQENKNDDGNPYYAGFTTPHLNFENPSSRKNFKRGFLVVDPVVSESIIVKTIVDEVTYRTDSISVNATDKNYPFLIGANGRRIRFEVYNNTVNENFFINQLLVDFKDLGSISG